MKLITLNTEDFIGRLKKEVLVFEFTKVNGELRQSIGTICPELIPINKKEFESYKKIVSDVSKIDKSILYKVGSIANEANKLLNPPAKKSKEPNKEVQVYWDFRANGFRSLKINSLSGIYE